MVEEGIVIRADGKSAKVLISRRSACDHCHTRGFCQMVEADKLEVSARNDINARAGQEVVIEIPDKAGLAASFLAYFMPTLLFIGGILIGLRISNSALAGALGGFAGIGIGLAFAAYMWKRHWLKSAVPRILSIKG